MTALTTPMDSPITMSSLELVEFINGQRGNDEPPLTHANFLAKVSKVLGDTSHSFECDLPDAYGRPRRGYRFPKREACLMAMSYSYELQAKVFDRMTELEAQLARPIPMTRMEILRLAMDAELARIEAEALRDEAVRTKALIGSKHEATAMATAAKAAKEVKRLTEELGRSTRQATITAVEKALGRKLDKQDWVPLRRYCKSNGLPMQKVHDPRWGEATAWPAEAWRAVHGIDLAALFPDRHPAVH